MSTTKSVGSDEASATFSAFIRRIATSVFPSLAVGHEDCLTDASSFEEDEDLQFSHMVFGPVEFHQNSNHQRPHNHGSNYHSNKNHRHFSRTSHQTVLTERDSAWFYTGHEGAAMDDFTDEGSTPSLRNKENGNSTEFLHFPVSFPNVEPGNTPRGTTSSSSRKHKRYNRHSDHRRKKQHQLCDTTTIALLVLCIVLTMILGTLIFVLDPTRKTNTATNNNGANISKGVASNATASQPPFFPDFPIPTITPAVVTKPIHAPTVSPIIANPTTVVATTRSPIRNPTSTPTRRPTVFVPRAPPTEKEEVAKPTGAAATTPSNDKNDEPQVPPLSMGPMVGHTTHDSVTLWAYHEFAANNNNEKMEILIYDYGTDALLQKVSFVPPNQDKNNAFVETIQGLKPSTSYKYGMHIRGERVGKGSFTTAPPPLWNNSTYTGTRFDYVLASCMNYRQYKNQIVWDVIAEKLGGRYPDFSILAGDTVYLQEGVDITPQEGVKLDRVWFRNQEQRSEKHFSKFLQHVPTYATWNDHEYGSNNGDKNQAGKFNSLKAWESLWANPGYGDTNTDDGVYYSYYWGDVHYIVTDDHWYRDPSQDNRLGTKQTDWIREELVNSKGTFKVIVIGSDIMEREWTSDLNNIGDIVRENSIDGVVFHAGDIHRNEYKEMVTGGFPYPVKQITSSGIAKVWRRPFVHIQVDTILEDPTMTAFFYGASSTAEITTWSNDPSLVCSSIEGIDRTKEHSCTETIRLSDLTVS